MTRGPIISKIVPVEALEGDVACQEPQASRSLAMTLKGHRRRILPSSPNLRKVARSDSLRAEHIQPTCLLPERHRHAPIPVSTFHISVARMKFKDYL